jgi:hypothetical protein
MTIFFQGLWKTAEMCSGQPEKGLIHKDTTVHKVTADPG